MVMGPASDPLTTALYGRRLPTRPLGVPDSGQFLDLAIRWSSTANSRARPRFTPGSDQPGDFVEPNENNSNTKFHFRQVYSVKNRLLLAKIL